MSEQLLEGDTVKVLTPCARTLITLIGDLKCMQDVVEAEGGPVVSAIVGALREAFDARGLAVQGCDEARAL